MDGFDSATLLLDADSKPRFIEALDAAGVAAGGAAAFGGERAVVGAGAGAGAGAER